MEMKEFLDSNSEKRIYIKLDNGIVYMNERVSRVLKLYDSHLIIDAINCHMNKMRNTGILNTGKIDLPSGFHMFGSFFSISGVSTYLGIKAPISSHEQSISNNNLYTIGYYGDEEQLSIREYAKRLFELKKKYTGIHDKNAIVLTFSDDEIDWERCFDQSYPDTLYKLFHDMQYNFHFQDIENMIYAHSLFGEAYTNAVKRVSKYNDDGLEYINIPESCVVYDEFRKILRKYYYNGFKFSTMIFVSYVADFINPNKNKLN